MRKSLCCIVIGGLAFLLPLASWGQDKEITTNDLIQEMISLSWLALDFPAETRLVQFSSYDRLSRIENGDTVEWWANADLGHYLRQEQTKNGVEFVMAEATGPGVIVRMWSANPGRRPWRIYLDGSADPVIAAPGKELLTGQIQPWLPPLAQRRNMGANLIFPIPFAKSVKITVQGKGKAPPLMYYQVDLRLLPKETKVRSFSWAELSGLQEEIEKARRLLSYPDQQYQVPQGTVQEAEVSLAPAAEGELFTFRGPAAIALLELTVKGEEKNLDKLLGQTLLLMRWDQEKKTSVAVPLGDFFGTSPGANDMQSLPVSVHPVAEGVQLVSRWVMPFQTSALLSLKNLSDHRLNLRAKVILIPWDFGADSLYFHAGWREMNQVPTRPRKDLRLLAVQGRGHFVGLEMNVRNHLKYFWWGEGDEKVWVDDDQFPSVFGTGTEDYFGYAWCVQYFKFTSAFHGVSLPTREWLAIPQALPVPYVWESLSRASQSPAIVSQYRFQILDALPFESSLRFYMELSHHRNTTVDINATAFWYAAPGSEDDVAEPELGKREVWKK